MPKVAAISGTNVLAVLVLVLAVLLIHQVVAREIETKPAIPINSSEVRRECVPCNRAATRAAPLFPGYFKPFEFVVDFYGFRYRGHVANLIDRHVLHIGAYEKNVLFFMRDALRASRGPDGVLLDVGANTGQHSLFMSRYARAVHAFEPYPPVLTRFRNMIEENRIGNVKIYPVGLGEREGTLPFHAPPEENLGSGSFVRGFQPENRREGTLQIVVGDTAVERARVGRIDLIKIDVEGFEKPVLRGLAKTLSRYRPIVVVEVTIDPRHEVVFKDAKTFHGAFPSEYSFYTFVHEGPRALLNGAYRLKEWKVNFSRPGQRMVVACPNERRGRLPMLAADEQ